MTSPQFNPYGQSPSDGGGAWQSTGVPTYGRPEYATWISRALGYLIDGLIVGVVPVVLAGVGAFIFAGSAHLAYDPATGAYTNEATGGSAGLVMLCYLLAGLGGLVGGLWLCHREGTTGQTPGKRIAGIRLQREIDGAPIGFGAAVLRKLCHVADALVCYVGFLWPLWDEKAQTFADKIAGTVVVKASTA